MFTIENNYSFKNKNTDTFSIMEVNDMSSDWLGWLFCYSFIFY